MKMDTGDGIIIEATQNFPTMDQENPLPDASEVQAQTPASSNPESREAELTRPALNHDVDDENVPMEAELTLPTLNHDDENENARKVFRAEIPDSDALSPVSSPEKKCNVDAETPRIEETPSLIELDPTGLHCDDQVGDQRLGEQFTSRAGGEQLGLDVDVTNEAAKSTEPNDPLPGSVEPLEVENSVVTNITVTSPPQVEDSVSEQRLIEDTTVALQEDDATPEKPTDPDKKISEEAKETEIEDEILQISIPDAPMKLVKVFPVPGSKEAGPETETSAVHMNDQDTLMTDEGSIQVENLAETGKLISTDKDSEKGAEESELPMNTTFAEVRSVPDSDEELPDAPAAVISTDMNSKGDEVSELYANTSGEVRSIPDSDDEELPDAPALEDVPEPEPQVTKKGKGKPKVAEKTTGKIAKKRGRPRKVAAPEVQEDPEHTEMDDMAGKSADNFTVSPRPTNPEEPPTSHEGAKGASAELINHGAIGQESEVRGTNGPTEVLKQKSPPPSPRAAMSSSPAQRSTLSSPVKVRISPNPSFKMPSPVKKGQSSSLSIPSSPSKAGSAVNLPQLEARDNGQSGGPGSPGSQGQNRDVVMEELKAIKMASIQARITSLQEEIEAKKAKRDELQKDLRHPAAETVKRHIKLLHDYNDIKDIGQGLLGMIADQRGLRVGELYEEFGVDLKD